MYVLFVDLHTDSRVSFNFRVSDAGIRFVIESAPGAQLRELNLTNCSKICDVSILRMSQRFVATTDVHIWLLIFDLTYLFKLQVTDLCVFLLL